MRTRGIPSPFLLVSLVLALLLIVAAACGDDDEEEDGEVTAPELTDGTLQVCSDIAYAPMEFYPAGSDEADGFDVDLGEAISAEFGVEVEFINTGFDGIIASLNTDDCDAIMSAMTVTEERSQEIDFVQYLNVGTGIVVPEGNPEGIEGLEDLCGLTVAVQLGTIQEELANEIECAEGDVEVVTFDTNPLAVEDVRTGGADANMADLPVAALDVQESGGALELVEPQIEPEPYGIGVRKDSAELKAAFEEALGAVKDDGTYDDLLEKWGLELARLD